MPVKHYERLVIADIQAVWMFHSSAEALTVLTPASRKVKWISTDLTVRNGAIHEFKIKLGPFWVTWRAELSEVDPPRGFVDTALKSPFKSWTHRHEFVSDPGGTLLRDTIEYVPPFGILGALADKVFIAKDIDRLFAFRHEATAKALEGEI